MPRRRYYDDNFDFPRYVSAGERRMKAEFERARLAKQGKKPEPVVVERFQIAQTFWGKAWCENLEGYSDFVNRLPRGRSYVRSGAVIDLKIGKGVVKALVSGSRVYEVEIKVKTVPAKRWKAICSDCSGQIESVIELLRGEFSQAVMSRLCQRSTGLFPSPAEIRFKCSCPDSARLCKHLAAVLYGVGARLDEKPELLFTLRSVNQQQLIARAGKNMVKATDERRVLEGVNLSEIFGIDIVEKGRRSRRS